MVLIINSELSRNWEQGALFSVAVGVDIVVEMLPAIVDTNLVHGAYLLSRKRTIVKRPKAIQILDGISALAAMKLES